MRDRLLKKTKNECVEGGAGQIALAEERAIKKWSCSFPSTPG
jgi:hypothetical protein